MSKKNKLGRINLGRHRIGTGTTITCIIGGAFAVGVAYNLLYKNSHAYTSRQSCEKDYSKNECDTAFAKAEVTAKRTALKYMLEKECSRDFGSNSCVKRNDYWQPKIAGVVMYEKQLQVPFFVTSNPNSRLYGEAFLANGYSFAKSKDVDGYAFDIYRKKLTNYCSSKVDQLVVTRGCYDVKKSFKSSTGLFLDGLVEADYTDFVGYKAPVYNNNQYSDQDYYDDDSNNYHVSSGTAHISNDSHYHSSKTHHYSTKSHYSKTSYKQSSYHSTASVSTRSRGGFGSTGSSRGGFFGG
ncbi:DUF1190 domain-containing protein [Vibrio marisflavi]|uniref:DUF1190 domain-containing protein n=1 Tax=Vibrio marisflavi CECT 7928 TaxID=634439 RepID=A0ABM9A172_9VIBR|nr:DUF1190 domain-containing protein [Vibrio marisflavi]CAH0537419.1 hypothetical protein VMF7928_01100 [Vibrio marisflavi CECT 7928]